MTIMLNFLASFHFIISLPVYKVSDEIILVLHGYLPFNLQKNLIFISHPLPSRMIRDIDKDGDNKLIMIVMMTTTIICYKALHLVRL